MIVVLDGSAKAILSNFNLHIYNNIEGIIQLLFAGSSIVDINSVFVFGKKHNNLELICDNEQRFQLLFEYKNEFFEDCIIFRNDTREMKYEFYYDKGSNCYSLKLHSLQLKKDIYSKIEILFYGYGKHLNIYLGNQIFSFDIQGKEIKFDFYKFEKLFVPVIDLNLVNILKIIELCVDMEVVDKILIDEYQKNQLVKNLVVSENKIIKTKVLNLKKEKC